MKKNMIAIPTTATLSATTLYFRSEYLQGSVFVGPTRPTNLQTPVADYLLHTDVYYVSPWTVSSTESPQVPALYRMTLGPGPAMTAQLERIGGEDGRQRRAAGGREEGAQAAVLASVVLLVQYWRWSVAPDVTGWPSPMMVTTVVRLVSFTTYGTSRSWFAAAIPVTPAAMAPMVEQSRVFFMDSSPED